MARHLFDGRERATHSLVAHQLRSLADEIAEGCIDLADEEACPPTVIVDPMEVTVDLAQHRREVELTIRLRWPLVGQGSA